MCFTLFKFMERKREQWLLLLLSWALMSVILSQVIRREALFVSGSCLVCHQRFRLKWLAARLELLNLSAHRRFLNGVSVCGGACFSVPVQSRKPRTGRTHSFWPLWLTELLPCSHFWNGPQGPMQQSPAWMQGASWRQKCPLGSLLGMCVDGAHFHLASQFSLEMQGFFVLWGLTEWILTAGVFLKAV